MSAITSSAGTPGSSTSEQAIDDMTMDASSIAEEEEDIDVGIEGLDLGNNGLPEIEDPSYDIRLRQDDLESLFKQDLEFEGSYYFSRNYPDAPNLCLQVETLGRIGLPLREVEAKRVISHSRQAPFGKGERTLVDTSVRDTWEIDGAKVTFDNPRWANFMEATVRQVCESLGVHFDVSRPRWELYKSLLYEAGSHFLAHKDTEKANGMFATIIVILPSKFSGGSVHLSHGDESIAVDFSTQSSGSTSVVSWYTDVTHEFKPVTSGYRLALSYNLIHTSTSIRPSISSGSHALHLLRHILLSWQQTLSSSPSKIVYLLQHEYAQDGLRGSALKGKDAHIVALLASVAEECQIKVGLASIECHVTGGCVNDCGDSWEDRHFVPEMDDVDEREMTITGLVDLEGDTLKAELQCEDEGETIPEELRDEVEEGKPDEEEYEGYSGTKPDRSRGGIGVPS